MSVFRSAALGLLALVTLCSQLAAATVPVRFAEGVAHGFQTLVDGSEVFYQMAAMYRPEASDGVRWNDPAFSIVWPAPCTTMSERDASYPDFVV